MKYTSREHEEVKSLCKFNSELKLYVLPLEQQETQITTNAISKSYHIRTTEETLMTKLMKYSKLPYSKLRVLSFITWNGVTVGIEFSISRKRIIFNPCDRIPRISLYDGHLSFKHKKNMSISEEEE